MRKSLACVRASDCSVASFNTRLSAWSSRPHFISAARRFSLKAVAVEMRIYERFFAVQCRLVVSCVI